jgi:hypothetical protein
MTFPGASQHGLPAPPNGAELVIARARQRRTRRRSVLAAAVGVVGVVGALTLSGGTTTGAQDRLTVTASVAPTTGASSQPIPTATLQPSPTALRNPGAPASPTPSYTRSPSTPTSGPARTVSVATRSPSYTTPQMTRTYATATAQPRVCASGSDQGTQPVASRVNWCLTAAVIPTSRGHDLSLQICRDNTSSSTIDFPSSRETDLTVIDATGSARWRWSTDHSATAGRQTLKAAAGSCFAWTVAWTDVDASGRRLGRGSYSLTATTSGQQFQDLPTERTAFDL